MRAISPPTAGPAERADWLDVARGATITLVVLLHADLMLMMVGEWSVLLHLVALALFPLRMPLFFLVAGVLAAGMLARPPGRVLRERVAHYLWVWAVWTTLGYGLVNGLLLPALGLGTLGGMFAPRVDPLEHLLSSTSWAWFLYALALFFAAALALRRLPPALHLGIAVLLALPGVFGWGEAVGLGVLDRFLHYPYFVAGWLGAARLRRAAPRLGQPWVVLALGLLWVGLTIAAHLAGLLQTIPGRIALSVVAVPAALAGAVLLARSRRLSAPLRRIGRSTLAIYLLHPWLLLLLVQLEPPAWLPPWAWTLALVAAATALPLLLERPLARVPGLMALPWRGAPAAIRAGQTGSASAAPISRARKPSGFAVRTPADAASGALGGGRSQGRV